MTDSPTIDEAINRFLDSIKYSRSTNTLRTYTNGTLRLRELLAERDIDLATTPLSDLTEDAVTWLVEYEAGNAATTEKLYLSVLQAFFEYCEADQMAHYNMPRVKMLIQRRGRFVGIRYVDFDNDAVKAFISTAADLDKKETETLPERLRNLRDRALIIFLADTGLRIHEACNLKRGDINWKKQTLVIIGKGNKQALVRISDRAIAATRDYLAARQPIDGATGKPLDTLPLFARHDKGAGKKIKPITTATGRNIMTDREKEFGIDANLHPHLLRHYFVTRAYKVLRDPKRTMVLSRHSSLNAFDRYLHIDTDEADEDYDQVVGD